MKITETITRDCCLPKDLKPYNGTQNHPVPDQDGPHLYFCIHCGQIWQGEHDRIPPATENIHKLLQKVTL